MSITNLLFGPDPRIAAARARLSGCLRLDRERRAADQDARGYRLHVRLPDGRQHSQPLRDTTPISRRYLNGGWEAELPIPLHPGHRGAGEV
jgi:hypothetical protein